MTAERLREDHLSCRVSGLNIIIRFRRFAAYLQYKVEKRISGTHKYSPSVIPAVFIYLFIFLFDAVSLLADPGLPRRLRATNLLWKGKTQSAINLLQDDVLVADPGTK